VAGVIGFIALCCCRSAWLARSAPLAYNYPPSTPYLHHFGGNLPPSYFTDKYPTHEMNVQPITFPSRGSVYGGTLGMGFGGYSGQGAYCNHQPTMGNNAYIMVKSSIPPN